MRIMYIFPHPDDEVFGPAPAILAQLRTGHEVHLLTLTKGGATKQRFKFGYTIDQMGEVRFNEMKEVAKVLGLTSLNVLDLPDSGLKDMDPRIIELEIRKMIEQIRPYAIVTYAVHGVSGFHDHLVTHAVVKRVFAEISDSSRFPRRLAFFTLNEMQAKMGSGLHQLKFSPREDIDCVTDADAEDIAKAKKALMCYKTYQEVIESTGIMNLLSDKIYFEIFREKFDPPLKDLCEGL
ncbi:MAG: PIG-L deacetylase family protein [Syntrophothermus sp.]